MLSQETIRKINDQIQDEIRTVNFIGSSHQEKMEAIERVKALKALFADEPKPTVQTRTNDVADTVREIRSIFRR